MAHLLRSVMQCYCIYTSFPAHTNEKKPGRHLLKKKAMLRLLINFILSIACFYSLGLCNVFFFSSLLLYFTFVSHARTHSLQPLFAPCFGDFLQCLSSFTIFFHLSFKWNRCAPNQLLYFFFYSFIACDAIFNGHNQFLKYCHRFITCFIFAIC